MDVDKAKRIFVIVYNNFCIGGIQVYFYHFAKKILNDDHRLIIVRDPKFPIDNAFNDTFLRPDVQCIPLKGFHEKLISIATKESGRMTILTYRVVDMAYAQKVRNQFEIGKVDVFYGVANFKGYDYYYEDIFNGKKKELVRRRMASIFSVLNENTQIRCFSISHIEQMKNRYRLAMAEKESVLVPHLKGKEPFNESVRRQVFHSDVFNILTISRLEFPHKGFVIGLIKDFGFLKQKYPNLTYTIVGYGSGEDAVREAIDNLPENARKSVNLVGKCAPDEMVDFYNKANVNISVAGCCSKGAAAGCLSLPTRHFTYDCEVYGYLPDSKNKNTSDEPGFPVIPFIEQIISMDEETYIAKCRDSYNAFGNIKVTTSYDDTNDNTSFLPNDDIDFIIKTNKQVQLKACIIGHLNVLKKEGIFYPYYFVLRRIRRNHK